ncbi:MAG: methyltransferase [Candidatus Korarchaeota archaeon]|nr:methyltransferase [Candidatus Korarchaeota archaeon]
MAGGGITKIRGITLSPDAEVYMPAEDTLLMIDALSELPSSLEGLNCLDVGTGTGILAIYMAKLGCYTVAADISIRAAHLARINSEMNGTYVEAVQGDLMSYFRDSSFHIITFNPPYIPEEIDSNIELSVAWAGGSNLGRELIDRFLEQLPRLLKEGGVSFLLNSSLNNPELTLRKIEELGMHGSIIKRLKLPFHELIVWKISRGRTGHL